MKALTDDLASDVTSGAWRLMARGENSELERMAARWRPEPEPAQRHPLPRSELTGSFDMGFEGDWCLLDPDRDDDLCGSIVGCSIPVIAGSTSRADRSEVDLAIRWADGHPNARWFVIRKLGALGLHHRIPSWPEVRGSTFSRDGRTWTYSGVDGSTVECPSLGVTVNGPAGVPRG